MLFNSYEFIFVYLPIVFIGYFFVLPRLGGGVRAGSLWISLASLVFYGYWDIRYIPLLLGSISFNFLAGRFIEHIPDRRKLFLIIGILGNLTLLGYYKYTAFFIENVNAVTGMAYEIPHIILPLGISFFTFTQTAYLIDAYRGETKGYSFLTYLLFVTIFPHLIAGPILNHRDMISQFLKKENLKINWKNLSLGITVFVLGLFKKVAIADALSSVVAEIFSRPMDLTFIEAWIGALGYTFQLYCDFSAYSEMAIGLGLMFNLHLPMNFNSPYQSNSIIDFWRRWHMTLGLWVKNYLYIPMGGNHHGELKKMRNLFVSMLIIGFWHGAGWTFIIWGGLHGIFLMINHQWRRLKAINIPSWFARIITFALVMLAWVFFRANTVSDAIAIIKSMADIYNVALPGGGFYENKLGFLAGFGISFIKWPLQESLLNVVGGILLLWVILFTVPNTYSIANYILKEKTVWLNKFAWVVAIIFLMIMIMMYKVQSEFLYFQF